VAVKLAAACVALAWAFSSTAAAAKPRRPPPSAWTERDPDRFGPFVPDFAVAHSGSFLGAIGAGLGYALLDDVVNLSLGYGYSPKFIAGESIHTFWFRGSIRPVDARFGPVRLVPVYLGVGGLYAFGDQYFTTLPKQYERGYYGPTAWLGVVHFGSEIDFLPPPGHIFERHGLYFEAAIHHRGMIALSENLGSVSLFDVLGSGFGYRMAF
jgi:hypothetical protein